MTPQLFTGLSAFPLTPASPDGRVDVEALGRLLERLVTAGVGSIGLLGSTGIYAYLERSERHRAVAAAVEAVAGRTPLIVGAGALRTDETMALARDAEICGADGLLVAPVSYTPPTEEEVFAHYSAVSTATALPICLYNNPGTTRVVFADSLLKRIFRLPNLAAVKMPLPGDGDIANDLARLRGMAPSDYRIGYSGDWGIAPALRAGADTFYSGIAGILPAPMVALARTAQNASIGESEAIDKGFHPLWALCRTHGAMRVSYAIGNLLALGVGAPPLPIQPLARQVMDEVAQALESLTGVVSGGLT